MWQKAVGTQILALSNKKITAADFKSSNWYFTSLIAFWASSDSWWELQLETDNHNMKILINSISEETRFFEVFGPKKEVTSKESPGWMNKMILDPGMKENK